MMQYVMIIWNDLPVHEIVDCNDYDDYDTDYDDDRW